LGSDLDLAEIGVRIALGAGAKAVKGMVVGAGIKLAVVGVAIGTVAAVAVRRRCCGRTETLKLGSLAASASG
jgi:hypothetical protein